MNRESYSQAFHPIKDFPLRWLPVALLILVSIGLAFGEEEIRLLGRYDRAAIAGGEIWRLVTGHLVHLSWGHTWLNLVALLLMTVLLDDLMDARDWVVAFVLAATAIDVGLFFLEPEVSWYVGLSGSLHGVMVVGAIAMLRENATMAVILLLGIICKLAWEQLLGPIPFSESTSGGAVLVDAHLFGAIGGLLASVLLALRRSRN
ncbi:MAG: rhombosortase [Gammaproteobacteria bacterium]